LEEILPDRTPKHFQIYLHLHNILQEEVFYLGFQLPRCHPPQGGYNWTPSITDHSGTVATLSVVGDNDSELEELES